MIENREDLIVNTPTKYSGLTGVSVWTGQEAIGLDAQKKQVIIQDVATKAQKICSYDKLVIAVGCICSHPPYRRDEAFRGI